MYGKALVPRQNVFPSSYTFTSSNTNVTSNASNSNPQKNSSPGDSGSTGETSGMARASSSKMQSSIPLQQLIDQPNFSQSLRDTISQSVELTGTMTTSHDSSLSKIHSTPKLDQSNEFPLRQSEDKALNPSKPLPSTSFKPLPTRRDSRNGSHDSSFHPLTQSLDDHSHGRLSDSTYASPATSHSSSLGSNNSVTSSRSLRGSMSSSSSVSNITASTMNTIRKKSPTKEKRSQSYQSKSSHENNSKIRVVIRIRPMSSREIERGYRNILEPVGSGNQIRVWDPVSIDIVNRMDMQSSSALDTSFWYRSYAFDRCLWSFSQGMDNIKAELNATQDDIFNDIGRPVLDWILGGYNCSVIAFGQTGAGKSFTMMGNIKSDAESFGLIPRICFGLFDDLEANPNDMAHQDASDEVLFSHLEIYNETIRDLLAEPMPRGGVNPVRLREHPQKGVFVAGLTTIRVTNFEEVMSLIALGESNRTVAATNSNLHSSRSHAIVTLTVNRRVRHSSRHGLPTAGIEMKSSQVHLVDLAGSERVTLSGAEGTRLKEANNINRSLSVLGDVIKCLGDQSKGGRGHIPYRNSTLTMVLRDSLGGNSHAVMITAVSPSSNDYEETISSLKYAERAKRVRMRVEANVTSGLQAASDSSALELVPILQAEIQKLREMLQQQQQIQPRYRPVYEAEQSMPSNYSHSSPNRRDPSIQAAHSNSNGNSRRNNESALALRSSGDHEEIFSSGEIMKEMQDRVLELEKQLEDREKLIQSLKFLSIMNSSVMSPHGSSNISLGASGSHPMEPFREIEYSSPGIISSETTRRDQSHETSIATDLSARQDVPRSSMKSPSDMPAVASPSAIILAHDVSSNIIATPPRPVKSTSTAVAIASHAVERVNTSSSNSRLSLGRPLVVLADAFIDKEVPHMLNLNQDPLFSECLVYYMPKGQLVVGSQEANVDILLTGPDILSIHGHIINEAYGIDQRDCVMISLDPMADKNRSTSRANTMNVSIDDIPLLFVNGQQITRSNSPMILQHHDRIAFGRFHFFRFEDSLRNRDPSRKSLDSSGTARKTPNEARYHTVPGWEQAHEELLVKNPALMNSRHQDNVSMIPSSASSYMSPIASSPMASITLSPRGKMNFYHGNNMNDIKSMNDFRQHQKILNNGFSHIPSSNSLDPSNLIARDASSRSVSMDNTSADDTHQINGNGSSHLGLNDSLAGNPNPNLNALNGGEYDAKMPPMQRVDKSSDKDRKKSQSSSKIDSPILDDSKQEVSISSRIIKNPRDPDIDGKDRHSHIESKPSNSSAPSSHEKEDIDTNGLHNVRDAMDQNHGDDRRLAGSWLSHNGRTQLDPHDSLNGSTAIKQSQSIDTAKASSFEAEALALQQELSQMQIALQERMMRYQRLASMDANKLPDGKPSNS